MMIVKKIRKISFVHIPKTAGISLTNQLLHYFDNNSSFQIRSESDRQFFLSQSNSNLDKLDLIAGHVSFPELIQKNINLPCISIVRSPVERLNSLLNYANISTLNDHDYKFLSHADFLLRQRDLNQFNMQCWHFTDDRTAASAIECIQSNSILVVPLERYDFLIHTLSKLFNFDFVVEVNNATLSKEIDLTSYLKSDDPLVNEDLLLYEYVSKNYLNLSSQFISKLQSSLYYC